MSANHFVERQTKRRGRALLWGSTAIAVTALGLAVAKAPAIATDLTTQARADSFERGYADLVETLLPAVVNVQIERRAPSVSSAPPPEEIPEFFRRFFEQMPEGAPRPRGPMTGVGSGFIIDAEGHIVTNAHVVANATSISVMLTEGEEFEAELIGIDAKTDLALLKIDAGEPMPFVEFGDSNTVRVGDKVLAVGNPFGLGGTVTSGIVGATGRQIGAGPYDDFLQIDAAINRGNSGGPTFNLDGEVIGVNSVIFSPSGGNVGIGFAISANLAEQIITDLQDDGAVERGWLGVNIQTLDSDLVSAFGLESDDGALVSKVEPESPAARARLRTGDIILAYNGTEIEALSDLSSLVADTTPGAEATLRIWRDGEVQEVDVRIDLMPSPQEVAALTEPTTEGPDLGLTLETLENAERAAAGLGAGDGGIRVTAVEPDSPAAEKGLRPGDIILRVDETAVTDPGDVQRQIRAALDDGKDVLLVLVQQEGGTRFLTLPLSLS